MAALHSLQAKDGGDVTKLSVPELLERCSDLRRNLACLLTHTQRCVAVAERRDQHAKVILEARKYIAAVCEADESVKGKLSRLINHFENDDREDSTSGTSVSFCGERGQDTREVF